MVETLYHFFLHLLIKHQEPLWKTGAVGEKGEVWSEDCVQNTLTSDAIFCGT